MPLPKTFATLAVAASVLGLSAVAGAQSSLVSVSRYATGFAATAQSVGPIGIAFDSQNRLFVTDAADGWLYRFDGPGGVASPTTRIGSKAISKDPGGLAFDDAGNLYSARYAEGDVVEIDPASGEIIRLVAKIRCALGVAFDPVSGGLFISSCTDKLFRIADPRAASPQLSAYASGIDDADGVAVGPDGTIYLVEGGGGVFEIKGTTTSDPGHVTRIGTVLRGDGISVGNGFLILNGTNGFITRLDLTGATPPQQLYHSSSRGDFSTVGSDGCLYATQTDHILRVTDRAGGCTDLGGKGGLAPTTPEAEGSDLPAKRGCLDRRRFRFRLHHGPRATVVRVSVFVNGKRRVHKRGTDIKRVTLKRLPKKKFRVRVVSVHSNGSMLISRRTYRGCKKSRPSTRRHSHR